MPFEDSPSKTECSAPPETGQKQRLRLAALRQIPLHGGAEKCVKSSVRRLACALAAAGLVYGGEWAVLGTGYTLRIERHEADGAQVRLYLNGGFVELPATAVARFEADEPKPVTVTAEPADLVGDAARRYGLPAGFLRSVAKAESGLRADAVSPKGAVGIMQLMPATARALGADPTDPQENVEAGTRYLSQLLLKYKDDPYQVRKALAAYNAGPGAVERYQGVPPYRETVEYVERVIKQAGLGQ
jgi:soluble lytic murein transglycosylase-like protein